MIKNNLLLDVPPGIGLLGMAAEHEGYCVVNGPDLLWGKDMRSWHPVKGVFEGVIGGPPCQCFSQALVKRWQPKTGNLIPEFERIVYESQPDWFLMENVKEAPLPIVDGYKVQCLLLNNRQLGEIQNRLRRISFGTRNGAVLNIELQPEPLEWEATVTASEWRGSCGGSGRRKPYTPSRPYSRLCELQGLPRDFLQESPFTVKGKIQAIGNGVPLPMGIIIFRAIRKAMRAK